MFDRAATNRGFSIVEVLVVMAIITLLVAIVVPSLTQAAAQARSVKCMANTSTLAKGIEAFRNDHRGRAQLVASAAAAEWRVADASQRVFAYEQGADTSGRRLGLPWTIAYGQYVGEPGLRSASDMFNSLTWRPDVEEQRRLRAALEREFGTYPVFLCPADDIGVNRIWSPSPMIGALSYGMNEDICGLSGPGVDADCWAFGLPSSAQPPGRSLRRLEGRLEKVFQPSRVVLVGDVGAGDRLQPALLNSHRAQGPYLEHFQQQWGRLPAARHGRYGQLNFVFVDGHAETVRRSTGLGSGAEATVNPGYRYSPRVRISPYRPF